MSKFIDLKINLMKLMTNVEKYSFSRNKDPWEPYNELTVITIFIPRLKD